MNLKGIIKSAAVRAKLNRPPVIIGGCGRSGTTLLLAVLSAHPRFYSIPFETYVLCPEAHKPHRIDPDAELDPRSLFRIVPFQKILFNRRNRLCEKTPKNVVFFGRILRAFSERVRLVHIVRDGRDVITSRHPKRPGEYWTSPQRWINDVSSGVEYIDHPCVSTVRYEDLITDFENTIDKLLYEIGEDLCEEVLSFTEHATVRNGPWVDNPRLQGLYAGSIGRWRREEHREAVKKFMQDPMASTLLERLGYEI
ncbi:MAG: hypothetical protein GF388_06855 [Candidatus Aegiribacteria sp.]|nr:hypothetical protein [Candidatus Aegiribacteria sp.]MBD3294865.1 hypothetical protein [Candidatus Fermentibacteria bacterium]